MLIGILVVVFAVFLYPTVLGQSVEFDQECFILKTLDTLETRLQEQDARLKLQELIIQQQKTQNDQQEARLEQQDNILEQQTASLESQEARIRELEANSSKQLTGRVDDHKIGFFARNPSHKVKSLATVFSTVTTNEGGGYNASSGKFNCIVAGLYSFSLHLIKVSSSSINYAQCYIIRNHGRVALAYTKPDVSADDGFFGTSASAVVQLSPGDVVYPASCSYASSFYTWSSFSGFLIRAD